MTDHAADDRSSPDDGSIVNVRRVLRATLGDARRAGDRPAAAALRAVLAALDNAQAVPEGTSANPAAPATGVGSTDVERRALTNADVTAIVEAELADLDAAAVDYERVGRPDAAEPLRHGAASVRSALGRTR